MGQAGVILFTIIAYKIVLVAIGIWAARKIRNEDDFFVGGRGLGAFVSGMSYAASSSSAWALLGFSGFVYASGLQALWMLPGIWGGYVVVWLWIGGKLRRETAERKFVTLTDYLVADLPRGGARVVAWLSAIIILFCFIFYTAAQFEAAAKAFADQLGFPFFESLLASAIIITIYSLIGGFWAVSVTDTLQGTVMAIIAVGLPIAAVQASGGVGAVVETLRASAPEGYLSPTGNMPFFTFLGFAVGLISTGLGTFGQPHLLARLMAVKDERSRRFGFLCAMGWGIVVYIGMAVMALSGRALTNGVLADGEVIFYRVAEQALPLVLSGLVIAAILSAVMSTVDSILLSASAALAHDLGLTRNRPKTALLISRLAMLTIVSLAVVLVLFLPDKIFTRVLFAWSALGAAFGPLVFARLLNRSPGPVSVIFAMASGFGATVAFYLMGTVEADNWFISIVQAPGDVFERLVPWILPLLILFFPRKKGKGRFLPSES